MANAFEYVQNVQIQIILLMCKVSFRAFALRSYILWYPMIPLMDSDGPDRTTDVQAVWAFPVHKYPDWVSYGKAYMTIQLLQLFWQIFNTLTS